MTRAITADPKISQVASTGLAEVYNSLAYRLAEVEKHLHCSSLRYGKAAGDELSQDSLVPFVPVAGAIGVLGALTTVSAGGVVGGAYMDIDHVMVLSATGNAGDIYEGIIYYGVGAPDTYLTAFYYVVPAAGGAKASAIVIQAPRIPSASKLGIKIKCSNADETLSVLFGLHTYTA